jgi:hypothetical protein
VDSTSELHHDTEAAIEPVQIFVSQACFSELEATLYLSGAKNYLFGDNAELLDLGNVQILVREE